MNLITLTTDYGFGNHYAGIVKGVILSNSPDAKIIDITHIIEPFNFTQASFIFKNCYKYYPKKTIHIIDVLSQETAVSPHVVIFHEGQYFIGTDNGIFNLIFEMKPERVYHLDLPNKPTVHSFPGCDVFAQAACMLCNGTPIEQMGQEKSEINLLFPQQPTFDDRMISGIVIYVDSYENVITNISKQLFEDVRRGRKFSIIFKSYEDLTQISNTYSDETEGEKLAFFGTTGLLEIAINKGKASSLLGLKKNDNIRIDFGTS